MTIPNRAGPADPLDMPAQTPAEEPLGLVALWRALWKGKWLIAALTLGLAVLGIFLTAGAEPRFTAQARIVLQDGLADLDAADAGGSQAAATALTTLEARQLTERLMDREGLFDDPEFNPVLANEDAEPSAVALLAARALSALRAIGAPDPGAAEDEGLPPADLVRQATVQTIQQSVYLSPVRNGPVVLANATTSDPAKSARLADALARTFIESRLDDRLAVSDDAIARLEGRVAELARDVRAADEELKSFLTTNEIIPRAALASLSAEAADLEDRIAEAEAAAAPPRALARAAAGLDGLDPEALRGALRSDAALRDLAASLGGPPQADAELAPFVERLAQAAQGRRAAAERRVAVLADSLAVIAERLREQKALSVRVQQLEREADAASAIYNRALRRLNEVSVQRDLQDAGARLVSQAEAPLFADPTGRRQIVAIMGLLGAMTGILIVLVREATDSSVRGASDVRRIAGGLPVILLPRASGASLGRRRRWLRTLMSGKPTRFSEAVRRLRLALLTGRGDGPVVVGVFSALPGEGKTTQAIALARSFALIDRKVLLVEADMRMQRIGPLLGLDDASAGLRGLLLRKAAPERAVLRQEALGIDVLPAGDSPHNPADLVENGRFAEVVAALRAHYDVVVIDTPPMLVVPEARVMAQHVDRRVVVVDWGRCGRDDLAGVVTELDGIDPGRDVVALNRAPAGADGAGREHVQAYGIA